ncbi:MAG: hypothetical protein ACE141_17070 [Bryobacteraceae bacterium]
MRKNILLCGVALLAVFAVAASAADITGKWVAQIPGRQGGTMEQTFNFKQSGETLTGTVSGGRGDQEISQGKVSGDTVSFVTVMSFGGGEMKMVYKGTIAGNEIKFTRSMEGGPGGGPGGRGGPTEFVAKKAS